MKDITLHLGTKRLSTLLLFLSLVDYCAAVVANDNIGTRLTVSTVEIMSTVAISMSALSHCFFNNLLDLKKAGFEQLDLCFAHMFTMLKLEINSKKYYGKFILT